MSSEIHKYIETSIEKNQNLFGAEVISFPAEKKNNKLESLEINGESFWNIKDKSNVNNIPEEVVFETLKSKLIELKI